MDMKTVRTQAREQLKGFCRVCPVCNGHVCAGEVPGMGGTGTGSSFKANIEALAQIRLNSPSISGAGLCPCPSSARRLQVRPITWAAR